MYFNLDVELKAIVDNICIAFEIIQSNSQIRTMIDPQSGDVTN